MMSFEKGSPERKLAVMLLAKELAITSEIIRSAVINSCVFRGIRDRFDRSFPEMLAEAAEILTVRFQATPTKGEHHK